ncbi:SUMF1/EgtB/PvdO family nonheme iron enzyme [Acinetobacter sp. ANC 4648]|uniref:SUMF1/EgtB/PvdO family nonheme iron enzyme n=1 Tax=Acinetobacter sp. ANC 4648 TaxID=1977875 RepID=UPI000A34CF75|nr:SUMF1/EgtB/PvdO family nonheme iron enzyme [Acinetobacter sp. ANC 4648]OTG83789.1 sulfatase-modifying factor [Acinetobacter sp. ANC 4648]
MILKNILWISCSLLLASCNFSHSEPKDVKTKLLKLGNIQDCKQYSGLPENWLKEKHAGMVWVTDGSFELGSKLAYSDEINFGEKKRSVQGFWMDQTEVTIAQFHTFVEATHYITDAEKQNQAAVFSPDIQNPQQWWQLKSGYTWKTPYGKDGKRPQPAEPVRYVTKNDAEHYALWLNRQLPSELEWEYAAKANAQHDVAMHDEPKNASHHPIANYWQGEFPFKNTNQDQFTDVAPVGCFPANHFKLYDLIGNVWEWTSSPYTGAHDQHMGDYQHLRHQKIQAQAFVIKGGSFLCANNYCARFRASSRHPQELDLATSHVGFRTISKD